MILDAQYSPDGQQIATSSRDNTLRIWQAEDGQLQKLYTLEDQPISISWSPDGEFLASASIDGQVIIWGINSGSKSELKNLYGSYLNSISWSPDGSKLAGLQMPTGAISAWEVDTGANTDLFNSDGSCQSEHLSWSLENNQLLMDCVGDNTIKVWDITSGEIEVEIGSSQKNITTSVWSPDGNYFAIGYADGKIKVFELADRSREVIPIPSQGYEIRDLSWSPNSQRIASAESGGAVRIWDLPSKGEVSTFQLQGSAERVDWSANGDHIVVTTSIGTSPLIRRVWQSTEMLVRSAYQCCVARELTQDERSKFDLPLE